MGFTTEFKNGEIMRTYHTIRTKEEFNKILDEVKYNIEDIIEENDRLLKENNEYKAEVAVEKEIARLTEENQALRDKLHRGFFFTKDEEIDAKGWLQSHHETYHKGKHFGAIGGGYRYVFYPTAIGEIYSVECEICKNNKKDKSIYKHIFRDL